MLSFYFIQPVYLSLLLKKGKGKDFEIERQTSTKRPRKRLSTSISINGEVIDTENQDVNIHDYATFEKEEQLIPEFRISIKSKTPRRSISREDAVDHGLQRKSSFKNVAKQVVSMESVLMKWPRRPRSRHHSSSSEDIAEDEINRFRGATADYNMNQEDNISVNTDTSELSDSQELDTVMSPREIEIHTASLAGSDLVSFNDDSDGNLNKNNASVDEIAKTDEKTSTHKRHNVDTDKDKHDNDVLHEHEKEGKDGDKTGERTKKRFSIFRCPCVVL